MKKIFTKEVTIGLCVILAIGILFFGINYLKGVNIFKAANYYYASYTNVAGLTTSAPVNLNGFKVGQVRSIQYEYDNPGHVLVELALDKHLKLPVGTEAVISQGLLGTASIDLKMGTSSEFYKVGSKIEGGTKAGMLDAVGSTVMPAVDNILPKIDTLLSNINAITGDPALLSSVQKLDAITSDLQRTTANLAALTSQMAPMMQNVNATASNAAAISGDLSQVTGQLKEAPIDSIINDLQATTANLKALTEELNNPDSSLGKIMNDPALYNNINATVLSLDSLFVDIKQNPKRYINVKVF